MGIRDERLIDDDRADTAMRQVLGALGEPAEVAPPPDLVARTLRRLPAAAPAHVARATARRRARLLAFSITAGALILAVAVLTSLSSFGIAAPLTFGDGSSGLSRLLLALHLLTKPLLRSVGTIDPLLLAAGAILAIGGGWLWWWFIRRTPIYAAAEAS